MTVDFSFTYASSLQDEYLMTDEAYECGDFKRFVDNVRVEAEAFLGIDLKSINLLSYCECISFEVHRVEVTDIKGHNYYLDIYMNGINYNVLKLRRLDL